MPQVSEHAIWKDHQSNQKNEIYVIVFGKVMLTAFFFYHGLLLVDFKEPSINIKYSLYKDRLDKLHKAIKNARTGMISHGLSVAWQCSFTYYEHFAGSGSENMGNSHIPSLQPQSVTKYLSFVHTLTESFKETAILLCCRHRDYGG